MKSMGYGKGYRYAHDFPGHYVEQQHLPDPLAGQKFYEPSDQGAEAEVRQAHDRNSGAGDFPSEDA
jgi:putative ATPase